MESTIFSWAIEHFVLVYLIKLLCLLRARMRLIGGQWYATELVGLWSNRGPTRAGIGRWERTLGPRSDTGVNRTESAICQRTCESTQSIGRNHWIGIDQIHRLTLNTNYALRKYPYSSMRTQTTFLGNTSSSELGSHPGHQTATTRWERQSTKRFESAKRFVVEDLTARERKAETISFQSHGFKLDVGGYTMSGNPAHARY